MWASAKQAYQKLTISSSKADLESWWQGESEAQEWQVEDVKSMDYFAVKTNKGEPQHDIASPGWLSTAPGKAEVQLELTNDGIGSGNAGLIDFLAQGIRIQESQ